MTDGASLAGGVDEAGRGCLLGPLVVAGISVSKEGEKRLKELGVRDSKLLTPKGRERLYPEVLRIAERAHWASIAPEEIDRVVSWGRRLRKLNYLEATYFAKVIDGLGVQRVTVDASDVIPDRFRRDIERNLASRCEVVARHKADRDCLAVSAASIVAKVRRDRAVEALRRAHGDFGSGYPSDPVTRRFFTDQIKRGEPLPDFVRRSWKTWFSLERALLTSF